MPKRNENNGFRFIKKLHVLITYITGKHSTKGLLWLYQKVLHVLSLLEVRDYLNTNNLTHWSIDLVN